MDVRSATPGDAARIKEIAEQSFQTSYSLSPDQIDAIVEEAFSEDRLRERMGDEASPLFVLADDEEAIGFLDLEVGEESIIRWLHVEPGNRGRGAGTKLFERAQSEARDRDLPLVGHVLAEDTEGSTFCERFGFQNDGKAELELADETFFEQIYVEDAGGDADEPETEPSVEVPATMTVEGTECFVDRDDEIPGTDAPFFRIYEDEDGEDHYGYFCSNCGSTNTSSDSLGRLECGNCGNKHLADEWDGAYL